MILLIGGQTMSINFNQPPWRQIIIPHKDIISNQTTAREFVVDLGDLQHLRNDCQADIENFFERTYFTEGLVRIIETVLLRLSGQGGDPVILLQAEFGGGKTHTLLTLYHLLTSPVIAKKHLKNCKRTEKIASLLESIENAEKVHIITFTGTQIDPLTDKTLWGEIATQLGKYELIKSHDIQKVSPGKKKLKAILEDSLPIVILIDELTEYVAKIVTGKHQKLIPSAQILAFIQELTEVIAGLPRAMLVMTIPKHESEIFSEEVTSFLKKLKKILGRMEIQHAPVQANEIPFIIRKQLFTKITSKEEISQVIAQYQRTYEETKLYLPLKQSLVDYQKQMINSYPFHPTLINLLFERWSNIPTFQGIRGSLRILSLIISDLWKKKDPHPLILPGYVDLENPTIQRELLKHLDVNWEKIIRTEITEENARAKIVDQTLGRQLQAFQLTKKIATSIFLNSLKDRSNHRGITTAEILLMNLLPEHKVILLNNILDKFRKESWFLHYDKQRYFYTTMPNLNYLIKLREENIDKSTVEEHIYSNIKKMIEKRPKTHIWPKTPMEIPDKEEIQVIILPLSKPHSSNETTKFAREIYNKAGKNNIRVKKNMLILVAADAQQIPTLLQLVKRYLAIKEQVNEKDKTIPSYSLKEIKDEFEHLKATLPYKILMTYRFAGISSQEGVFWMDMGLPKPSDDDSLTNRAVNFLKSQQLIIDELTPIYLVDRVFSKEEPSKSLREIWSLFLSTPGFPILENKKVLINTIKEGCKQNLLEIKIKDQSPITSTTKDEIPLDAQIINLTVLDSHDNDSSKLLESEEISTTLKDETALINYLFLESELQHPEITWHDFYRGVIIPLIKDKDHSDIKISITIEWKSKKGLSEEILEQQIKESLAQLPIRIINLNTKKKTENTTDKDH